MSPKKPETKKPETNVMHSILRHEIYAQPEIIDRILHREHKQIQRLAGVIARFDPQFILIVARGSADNAGLYGKYLFGIYNQKVVALAAPSIMTRYGQHPDLRRALVLAISQSGQSHDVVETVEAARQVGALTIAVTNSQASPLANAAEEVLFCHAGLEQSVAATKTYTAQIFLLAMLSSAMARDRRRLRQLALVPEKMQQTLGLEERVAQVAQRFRYLEQCAVIGRGFCYGTAFELALKLEELTYMVAQPYSAADFRHGPIAVVDRGFCVVLLAPRGQIAEDMVQLMAQLQERQAEVVAISDVPQILRATPLGFPLPGKVPEWLAPLIGILPGQLLAMHLCQVKGYSLDRPRGLAKITRTR